MTTPRNPGVGSLDPQKITAVYVPAAEDEAMRDLIRAREDAKEDEKKGKQRLSAFLLRSGYRYSGRTPWTTAGIAHHRH